MQNGIPQISAQELKNRLDAGENLQIIDVREPNEYQAVNMGAKLIPMNEIPARVKEIDPARETILHCHAGVRSQRVAEFLHAQGYTKLSNLTGGILAWGSLQK